MFPLHLYISRSEKRTTTLYHPQTNRWIVRCSLTLVLQFPLCVHDHQGDWDQYVQPFTYGNNFQIHRSKKITAFLLKLSGHSSGPTTIVSPFALLADAYKAKNTQVLYTRFHEKLTSMKNKAPGTPEEQPRHYTQHFDTKKRIYAKTATR